MDDLQPSISATLVEAQSSLLFGNSLTFIRHSSFLFSVMISPEEVESEEGAQALPGERGAFPPFSQPL